jgi:hypothetical protein
MLLGSYLLGATVLLAAATGFSGSQGRRLIVISVVAGALFVAGLALAGNV